MQKILAFIERFKLTTKLLIGFSVGILIALAIGVNALTSLSQLQSKMETMYENDLLGISSIKDANLNLIYMSRAMRHMLIAQDDATRDASLATIKRSREKLLVELAEARKRIFRPEVVARYDVFLRDLNKALEGIEQAVGLIQREKMNPSVAAQFITSKEFATIIAAADGGLHELTEMKEKAANSFLEEARVSAANTQRTATVLLIAGVVLAGLLGVLIGLSIQHPNDRLRASVENLAAGKTDAAIPHVDYPNEIGAMARAIAVLQEIYRKSNEQHWVKTHSAEIAAHLQSAEDFRTLTQTAVSHLAPVVGAGHAALYVADAQGQFNLLASYGYRERKNLSSNFRLGEGLVGQCAMEKASILLSAPRDYIRISSGLGDGPPACVLVLPIIHAERVLGVLEMASFQEFSGREKTVLESIVPTLATSMEIMDRNLRTKELLAATQQQAERMEKQAAQLEEQTVEMEAQQAELLETENWFRSIIETAPDGLLVVDANGQILLANPMAATLLGYAPTELLGVDFGKHLRELDLSAHRAIKLEAAIVRSKDGLGVPLDISVSPLPDRGGRGKCLSVAMRRHGALVGASA
jgi:PAS domain S-box-containing protein